MINLLPYDSKKSLHADYWRRIYVVAFFFLAGALATLLLILGLIYFLLLQEGAPPSSSNPIPGATKEELKALVEKTKKELALFSSREEGYLPTRLFAELTAPGEKNFGVYLTELSYTLGKKEATVILSGNAQTREALVTFLSHLREKKNVTAVDSPIGSLSKSTNIPFSVTLHLTPYAGT